MIRRLLSTDNSWVGIILRITLAVIMLPMGYLKITDFSNILQILQTNYHLPLVIAFLVIVIEFFVPLFLVVGFGSRIGGILLAIVMFGATFYHIQNGFFMNWYNVQDGEGYQFHLLAIGAALALFISGGGRWSVDKLIADKMKGA